MIRYLKITLVDGARFILRVTSETPLLVRGYEVNGEGDEVVPTGYERRLRIVGRDNIKKAVPMRMNPTYATLEIASSPQTHARKKTATQLDAEIAEALRGPEWLVDRAKKRVDPKLYAALIKKAVKSPEFKAPSKYTWDLIRAVPISWLDPGSKVDYDTEPDSDAEEADENLARYYRIEQLFRQGEKPWPVVVNHDGEVIDGYHRLAVLNDQDVPNVDVLWVRPRSKS